MEKTEKSLAIIKTSHLQGEQAFGWNFKNADARRSCVSINLITSRCPSICWVWRDTNTFAILLLPRRGLEALPPGQKIKSVNKSLVGRKAKQAFHFKDLFILIKHQEFHEDLIRTPCHQSVWKLMPYVSHLLPQCCVTTTKRWHTALSIYCFHVWDGPLGSSAVLPGLSHMSHMSETVSHHPGD